MTKNNKYLTFYLGAGASFNAVPIVNEFPLRLQYFADYLSEKPETYKDEPFVKSLLELKSKIEQHSTFDVYAKKLFLQKKYDELNKFKFLISVFLTFEQISKKQKALPKAKTNYNDAKIENSINRVYKNLDIRYDSLFALLMNQKDGKILLDSNVKFISWNYDIQLELSMLNFIRNENNSLQDDFNELPHDAIIKLNGDGNILKKSETEEINLYIESNNSFDGTFIKKIIGWFKEKKYLEYESQIKFAWELDVDESIYKQASDIVKNSEYLVSIGYSFPNFNRPIDQFVFKEIALKKCKLYIQDLKPQQIAQNIEWINESIEKSNEFKHQNQVQDFYLPPSFNLSLSVKENLKKSNNKKPGVKIKMHQTK